MKNKLKVKICHYQNKDTQNQGEIGAEPIWRSKKQIFLYAQNARNRFCRTIFVNFAELKKEGK